ncbi:hypothetical protein BDA96_09G220800 [Sorghum bicolor]|uniref:Uncharacterized protein n=1 Tax=Sorghum bicolor TaxID=4558 RepID=A0A921QEN6_SORBI|nr:hypothetical protein BDA96_09G220800 [Sorghum bicolor]
MNTQTLLLCIPVEQLQNLVLLTCDFKSQLRFYFASPNSLYICATQLLSGVR